VFTARYGLDLDYEIDLRICKTVGKADSPAMWCRSDSSKPVTIHQNSGINLRKTQKDQITNMRFTDILVTV